MSAPRVSVVTPIRNAAPYLDEAVASVLAQTVGEWELLLVDDGSGDGSDAIARRHAAENPERIRYLEHEGRRNRGASASRNLGIRHARADLFAFLDADDVWLPEKLERQLALADAMPDVAMFYYPTLQWYSWTGDAADRGRDVLYDLSPLAGGRVEPPDAVARFVDESVPCPCTCSYLIRRSAFEAVGGFEDRFPDMYDDQVLVMKLHLRFPVYVDDRSFDRYRIRPDSVYHSAIQRGEVAASQLVFLDWLDGHLRRHGPRLGPVRRAVREQRWRLRPPRLLRLLRRLSGAAARGAS